MFGSGGDVLAFLFAGSCGDLIFAASDNDHAAAVAVAVAVADPPSTSGNGGGGGAEGNDVAENDCIIIFFNN